MSAAKPLSLSASPEQIMAQAFGLQHRLCASPSSLRPLREPLKSAASPATSSLSQNCFV